MPNPGYNCSLKITGSSTAFVTEAFTDLGAGTAWQITNSAKRIWSAGTIPSFFDNAVAISAGDIESIDYLFGIVTFTGVKTGPITATGNYFPNLNITEGHEFSLNVMRDMADTTVFGDEAHRRFPLLLDVSGDISVYDTVDTDFDPGGGTRTFKQIIDNDTSVVITMQLTNAGTQTYRVLATVTSFKLSASVDGIEEGTVSFQSKATTDTAGRPVHFSYIES